MEERTNMSGTPRIDTETLQMPIQVKAMKDFYLATDLAKEHVI